MKQCLANLFVLPHSRHWEDLTSIGPSSQKWKKAPHFWFSTKQASLNSDATPNSSHSWIVSPWRSLEQAWEACGRTREFSRRSTLWNEKPSLVMVTRNGNDARQRCGAFLSRLHGCAAHTRAAASRWPSRVPREMMTRSSSAGRSGFNRTAG